MHTARCGRYVVSSDPPNFVQRLGAHIIQQNLQKTGPHAGLQTGLVRGLTLPTRSDLLNFTQKAQIINYSTQVGN